MGSIKHLTQVEKALQARRSDSDSVVGKSSRKAAQLVPSIGGFLIRKGERNMWLYRKFTVRKHERGLLYRDGDFQSFLAPGDYRFFNFPKQYSVETFDVSQPVFEHALSGYLFDAQPELIDELFTVVETSVGEVALVYFNDKLAAVLEPAARALYWKGPVKVSVQKVGVQNSVDIEDALARRLVGVKDSSVVRQINSVVYRVMVPEAHVGLLTVDGKFIAKLEPGLKMFWQLDQVINVELVDLRVRTLEVQGQEILTSDKVALRINVTATYQFADPALAASVVKDPLDHLYKEIQFGLRAAVGTRSLDKLLEDKTAIDLDVAEYLGQSFSAIGIEVVRVGVKDIILPGDMKELLAKVVEAEKAAQANVIRRREETNATRSLLNTAKVMESNTIALRLKELETLERVTENVGSLSVYGGLDGVMNQLVQLKP